MIRVLFYSREIRCRSFSIGDYSLDSPAAAAARARDGHALHRSAYRVPEYLGTVHEYTTKCLRMAWANWRVSLAQKQDLV
jgi:hypothetical protein